MLAKNKRYGKIIFKILLAALQKKWSILPGWQYEWLLLVETKLDWHK